MNGWGVIHYIHLCQDRLLAYRHSETRLTPQGKQQTAHKSLAPLAEEAERLKTKFALLEDETKVMKNIETTHDSWQTPSLFALSFGKK